MYSERGLLKLTNDESLMLNNKNFDQEKRYYVYVYMDPRKPKTYLAENYAFPYEPFYIGKGTGKRMYSHFIEASKNIKNSYKLNKIRSILKDGYEPLIYRFTDLIKEEDAYYIENCVLISLKGYEILTNIKDGFNIDYKFINRELYRKIMSDVGKESYKKNPNRGKEHSLKILGKKNGRYGKGYLTSGERNGNYIKIDENKMIELYNLNFSTYQIGLILNTSSCPIKQRLKKLNKIRKIGRRSSEKTFQKRNKIVDRFKKGEITYEQLISNSR